MQPPPTAAPGPRAAFQHRDFNLLLGARFASNLAIQMQTVALGWQVYDLTHRPLDLGLVGLAQFLPAAALSLVTGHAADRFDRRTIVVVCQLAHAVCSLLLFAHARSGVAAVAPIYAILVLIGTARAFSAPAGQALLPDLVSAEHFENAVTWSQSSRQIAMITGPAIGGIVYAAAGGPAAVYAACALFAVCAFVLNAAIRTRTGRHEDRATSLETVLAGVRYVWAEKTVLGCISLDLFAVLLGGAIALLPIYARDILHVGPSGLGLLRAAPALGAATSGLFLAFRPLGRNVGRKMLSAVAVFGVATIAFGLSHSFALSLVALAITGAADMVSMVVRGTLVQLLTPAPMRGRVGAVNMLFIDASNELGEFESGVTAALFGVVPAVIVGGAGTCAVVALWAWFFPRLRRIDRLT